MVALKIHRRRYFDEGLEEVRVHQSLPSGSRHDPLAMVRLIDAFEQDGRLCLAFEEHGRALDSWIEKGPIDVDEVRRTARDLLLALRGLHQAGHVHTDIKAGNILYDPGKGARLADLGSARRSLRQGDLLGSREYTAPEVLVGSPLGPKVDLWALGCCLVEMLCGRFLFDPRAVAERKYKEFDTPDGLVPGPSARADELEEASEQFRGGEVLGASYRLEEVLGRGRFATVWRAARVGDRLGKSSDLPRIPKASSAANRRRHSSGGAPESWRRRKGADDLLDLALNYELAVQMAKLCGPFPEGMLESAHYRRSYFSDDGELRFRPRLRPDGVRERLRRSSGLDGTRLEIAADFLTGLLQLDPEKRLDLDGALSHPWIGLVDEKASPPAVPDHS